MGLDPALLAGLPRHLWPDFLALLNWIDRSEGSSRVGVHTSRESYEHARELAHTIMSKIGGK